MVRHDPLNIRGPTPPGGRPKLPAVRNVPMNLFQLRPVEEYKHLWDVAVSGAKSSLDIVAVYTHLQMPVDMLVDLRVMRDRLDKLIQEQEARNE